jgi:hypothetical protein
MLAGLLGLVAMGLTTSASVAAEPTFGTPTATAHYGSSIVFDQPATIDATLQRSEILLTFPGSIGPEVTTVEPPQINNGALDLRYTLDVGSGALLPNTEIRARWRLTDTNGHVSIGPSVTVRYLDTRFDWKTRSGSLVTVHWYQGDDAFGRRALSIAEQGVAKAEKVLGVTESEPIDFYVYADQQAFYDALGPGTRENVGGQANADIRTLFALITPSELDASWVGVVIPHELTHLVFNTAVRNPYHFPPRWLNEGLAVYLSQGFDANDRGTVRAAAASNELIPLDGLTGQFPTTGAKFAQAYAESVSAVDFLIRGHGQATLVSLIRSYAKGVTDDEAFTAAIGMDVKTFNAAWFADQGATVPKAVGPQPAPAGPVPAGWGTGATVGASSAPAAPVGSPTASAAPRAVAAAPTNPDGGGTTLPFVPLALAAVAVGLVLAGIVIVRTSRQPTPPPAAGAPPMSAYTWAPPPVEDRVEPRSSYAGPMTDERSDWSRPTESPPVDPAEAPRDPPSAPPTLRS